MASRPSSAPLTNDELQRLAQRAMSLCERAAHHGGVEQEPVRRAQVDKRLSRWIDTAGAGDRNAFARRLRSAGIDARSVAWTLQGVVDLNELPEWADIIGAVATSTHRWREPALRPDLRESLAFLRNGPPIPFEELLLPFIDIADERLSAATGGRDRSWPADVRAAFQRTLLQRLSSVGSRVLFVEFRTFLASQQLSGRSHSAPASRGTAREKYLQFVDAIYEDGWKSLLTEYCVLSRLMAVAVAQWARSTAEFFQRFECDLPEIRATLLPKGDPGRLAGVQLGLSDPHHGGRTVVSLQFESGARLIYKPKNTQLEAAYFAFVEWLNGTGRMLSLRCLKTLPRDGYGWSEYADGLACESQQAVRRFYHRLGMFLCLTYALNGTDFHFENLIACGEHPVPVDLETIFHHPFAPSAEELDLLDAVAQRLRDSVLRTHILPTVVRRSNQYVDNSAVARSPDDKIDIEAPVWKGINTDAVDYCYGRAKGRVADNVPKLRGRYCRPERHVGDIIDGFQAMYRFVLESKRDLASEGGVLHDLFKHESRFIFRATSFYDSVLYRALEPDRVRDGIDFSIELDLLAQRFAVPEVKPGNWQVLEEEINALWNLDVPKFAAAGTGTWLALNPARVVPEYFDRSAWEQVRQKLNSLDEQDLHWQISLIRGAMAARSAPILTNEGSGRAQELPGRMTAEAGKEELAKHARSLGEEIRGAAIYSDRGEPGWLSLTYLTQADRFALQAIPLDLYNGRSGIALFLAALERALPGSGFRDLAYSTVALVRRWIRKAGRKDVMATGIGGFVGIPSMIYGLARMAEFLGDGELLEDAKRAVLLIDEQLIESDRRNDVVGGAAGAILALLACRPALGDSRTLPIAIACGRRLLEVRRINSHGFRTWATSQGMHLTGFSHGSSGIACALLGLYRETGDDAFQAAAVEALDFENSEFVPGANNWPDRRRLMNPENAALAPDFKVAWCHGAPGIGLARLATLDVLDSARIRADIAAALSAAISSNPLPRDHLCCGNAGLADTLLQASLVLGEPEWRQEALKIAGGMIERAEQAGAFATAFENGFVTPTLFQGTAGVGYQLLRLAFPDQVPSVLLLQ